MYPSAETLLSQGHFCPPKIVVSPISLCYPYVSNGKRRQHMAKKIIAFLMAIISIVCLASCSLFSDRDFEHETVEHEKMMDESEEKRAFSTSFSLFLTIQTQKQTKNRKKAVPRALLRAKRRQNGVQKRIFTSRI